MSIDLPSSTGLSGRLADRAEREIGYADLALDPLDWRYKGLLLDGAPACEQLPAASLSVPAGDLPTPVLTLRRGAVNHNVALMARFCAEHGCLLAPHVKTSMSPELWRMQLDAGAWALTVATVAQVRALRAFGVRRMVLANQLVDRVALEWVAREIAADPAFDFYCLVDSLAGVRLMEAVLARLDGAACLGVLVEFGYAGGRTGCRDLPTALAIAEAVAASDHLALRGVEGFEGYIADDRSAASLAAVDAFLDELRELATEVAARGLVAGDSVLVSAGGSAYFDRVIARVAAIGPTGLPLQLVLRSGCYLTHDAGLYRRVSPLDGRNGAEEADRLVPALELWATVLSRPEPGLAIANFGKRDAGYDAGLPEPHAFVTGGRVKPADGQLEVVLLHDQHAHIRVSEDHPLAVGDMVVCGVSHPCTTLDRWRLIPVVGEDDVVVDAIHTFF